ILKTDSRKRSAVGRMSREAGEARLRPFNRPPTTRIRLLMPDVEARAHSQTLLVLWLQIALAVIAALGAARRAVAIGLGLVARAGLVAAGALHQHAAAFAVGDHGPLRLLAARRVRLSLAGLADGLARHRPVEIRARERCQLFAELLAQHPGLDLLDLALFELCELDRPVGDPDQPVHLEAEMGEHITHLAFLALADRKHQPDIGALVALQGRIDRSVFDAVDLDAFLQLVELGLRHLAMGADAIAPEPAGLG